MCLNVILLFFDSVDSNAYNDGLETFPTTVPPLAQADENVNMQVFIMVGIRRNGFSMENVIRCAGSGNVHEGRGKEMPNGGSRLNHFWEALCGTMFRM